MLGQHMTTQIVSRNNIYTEKESLFATQCDIKKTVKELTKDEVYRIIHPYPEADQ